MDDQELAKTIANEHELAKLNSQNSANLREVYAVCLAVTFSISAIMACITACEALGG